MERKNRNFRKRTSYYDDYTKSASGEYVYVGQRYEYENKSGKRRSVWMWEVTLMCIAAFGVLLPPGFMHVPGLNHSAYVLLPYGIGLITSGYLIVLAVRLAMAKDDVKAWEYDKAIVRLNSLPSFLAGVSVVCILCEIIYIILNGMSGRVLEFAIYIVCQLVSGAFALLILRHAKSVIWKPVERNVN